MEIKIQNVTMTYPSGKQAGYTESAGPGRPCALFLIPQAAGPAVSQKTAPLSGARPFIFDGSRGKGRGSGASGEGWG